jgi:1-acyl-sn-glycerol-3-phosphate acyltransferase
MTSGKSPPYRVPFKNRLGRWILRPLIRLLFHLLARVRINGRENVPKSGAYLIVINHISIFEPPFIIAFWPKIPEAMGAVDIWSKPGQSTLARMYGGIQVHRGEYDRQVIKKAMAVLESGRPLVIAPEGGRSHEPGMKPGLPGVAYLADLAHALVVPVGIVGTTEDFFQRAKRKVLRRDRPLLELNIGEPFLLPSLNEPSEAGESRHQARQRNVDTIMYKIAELLPENYRGVYQ